MNPSSFGAFMRSMGGRKEHVDEVDKEELLLLLWLRHLPPIKLEAAAKAIRDLTPQYGWS